MPGNKNICFYKHTVTSLWLPGNRKPGLQTRTTPTSKPVIDSTFNIVGRSPDYKISIRVNCN